MVCDVSMTAARAVLRRRNGVYLGSDGRKIEHRGMQWYVLDGRRLYLAFLGGDVGRGEVRLQSGID